MKFYVCPHCGNIVAYLHNAGVPVMCCGQKMEELIPCSTDAAQEKHVPVVSVNGSEVTVTVGDVAHPMLEEHYIQWVVLECAKGNQRKALLPGQAPMVKFSLTDNDHVVSAYAYCNLHGLWKSN